MKKGLLLTVGFLLLFTTQSFATVIGAFDTGTVELTTSSGEGNLTFHLGSSDETEVFLLDSFDFDTSWDLETVDYYVFSWETDSTVLYSGSITWYGTLQDFFNRIYDDGVVSLTVNSTTIDLVGSFYQTENGTGHIFMSDFSGLGFSNTETGPIALSMMQISTVPEPAPLALICTGLLGLAGIRKQSSRK